MSKAICPVALAVRARATVDRLCWVGAHTIAREFGGVVYGYLCSVNRKAVVGASAGGHNFCIVHNRWLVDAWASEFEGTLHAPVVDLTAVEPNWLESWYGPRELWERCPTYSAVTIERDRRAEYRRAGLHLPKLGRRAGGAA